MLKLAWQSLEPNTAKYGQFYILKTAIWSLREVTGGLWQKKQYFHVGVDDDFFFLVQGIHILKCVF